MAARVVLVNKMTGERKHMYTVDAKELLEADREEVRLRKKKAVEWAVDTKSAAAPPPTEDQKIAAGLAAKRAEEDRRLAESQSFDNDQTRAEAPKAPEAPMGAAPDQVLSEPEAPAASDEFPELS
ncbi:MAG: hypothetical protein GY778_28830 [bacterium]|nr:hypothetical protein [bacterium]